MKKSIFSIRLFIFSCVTLLTLSSNSSQAQTLSSTTSAASASYVYFGTPQSDGGVCVGTDICPENATNGGVNATFSLSSDYPNTIIMTFSLSDLQQIQPDQVAAFQSGSYMFSADYCLSSSSLFSSLNLPANSWILTTSNSYVQINGDVVTDYIQYSVSSN